MLAELLLLLLLCAHVQREGKGSVSCQAKSGAPPSATLHADSLHPCCALQVVDLLAGVAAVLDAARPRAPGKVTPLTDAPVAIHLSSRPLAHALWHA